MFNLISSPLRVYRFLAVLFLIAGLGTGLARPVKAEMARREVISGIVFGDADGDRVYALGEEGMMGITVQMYLDANSDGLLDGADRLYAVTQTGAQGEFLFSSVPARAYLLRIMVPDYAAPTTPVLLSIPKTYFLSEVSAPVLDTMFGLYLPPSPAQTKLVFLGRVLR